MLATRGKNKISASHSKATSKTKISKSINAVTTTQTQMARALKISQQRVSQMVQQGVIPVDDNGDILLVEGIKAYCRMKSRRQKTRK